MVVALMTLIVTIYHLVAEFSSPQIYNYWAVLGLDILLVIMWLSSFALLASQVATIYSYAGSVYYDYYGYSYGGLGAASAWAGCLAAASALGGVELYVFLFLFTPSCTWVLLLEILTANTCCTQLPVRRLPDYSWY